MIKETSVDAQIIFKRITSAQVGESIAYHELSSLIGRNVQDSARNVLQTARKMAQREFRMVFGTVRGEGLTRLDDAGIVNAGCSGLSKVRRVTRKHARILSCVESFDTLPNDTRIRHNSALSIFGALEQAASPKSIKKVEQAVQNNHAALLPVARTMEMFTMA